MTLLRRRIGIITSDGASSRRGELDDLISFIEKGNVIPVISNSLRIEEIFLDEETLLDKLSNSDPNEEELTMLEELTQVWAVDINYPMKDNHNLARVAQYSQTRAKEIQSSKKDYLEFLTAILLKINEDDADYKDIAALTKKNESFSRTARRLDSPRLPHGFDDPLRILAKLPLKIYVTTSPFYFMEQALEAENKNPRTQVCFWPTGKIDAHPEHLLDREYKPEITHPVVYHLFGLEDYPQTLVLSEDDYMNFLINVVVNTDTQQPIVPVWLRGALVESRLLLLGYQVKDWDFRVLFRFILNYRKAEQLPRGMLIQLNLGTKQAEDREMSIKYLSQYFDKKQFDLDWSNPEKFIYKLWMEWEKYRKGQPS